MRVLLTGGGTGGHVIPILAVVHELKRQSFKKIDFLWIGSKKGPEASFAKKHKIGFQGVLAGKFRRYFTFKNLIDFLKIPLGTIQAFFIIKKFRPDVVFSKGGYVSVPAVLAGWIANKICYLRLGRVKGVGQKSCFCPIIIHESDTVPGLANRFLARFANKIAISFVESKKYFPAKKCILTGNPVRCEIEEGSKERGFRYFGLEYGRPVILVTGGSQGSQKINEVVVKALSRLQERYQVIHLCGKEKVSGINLKNYKLYPFLEVGQMADALEVADLVISRCGSNILFEIAALGKPSILIPYPYAAGDHQRKNARVFEKANAALVIKEKDLTSSVLVRDINWLMDHPEKLDKMSAEALRLARPEAAKRIAQEILKLGK